MVNYIGLIDKDFFISHRLNYRKDIEIGDGLYINNDYVKRYNDGYYNVSMFLSLSAINKSNYASTLRRKVLELHYLNPNLYSNDHKLFVRVITMINDVMNTTRRLGLKSDIAEFIDNILDSVDFDVPIEIISRFRRFKPMPRVYDFQNDYEREIVRYRTDINIFSGILKSKQTMRQLEQCVTELGTAGMWINTESISDISETLFIKRLSVSYIHKLILKHSFSQQIKDFNEFNYGTHNEKTKKTVDVLYAAMDSLKEKGIKVSKSSIARESDLHLQTINYQFNNVESLKLEL